ncbi:hypothetical protein GIB67_035808 [Kingdonia uniflora]|uniref:separase n=1 Tax=Kingdonia uniflora TaxID=39325 RepID=A0A7J7MJL2_9MAGN|nr:hypothetical protein GIB67_035808 [Kingdonia uniflora]
MRLGALNLIELRETQRRNHGSFENQTLIFIFSIYLCNLCHFNFFLQSSSSQFHIGKFIGLDSRTSGLKPSKSKLTTKYRSPFVPISSNNRTLRIIHDGRHLKRRKEALVTLCYYWRFSDFIMKDVRERYFRVKDDVHVTLTEVNEIMSSFDIGLSQYATKHLTKCGVHLKKGVVKEGIAGKVPKVEELTSALKDHDLFIYIGHGNGMQYIPWYEIRKIENCVATILMGCCIGSISYKGCYNPQGAVISYLLAGSPVMIANLRDVTSPDIDRFGRSMLNAMFKERSISFGNCTLCNSVVQEFELKNKRCNKGNGKKKVLGERKLKEDRLNLNCGHRQMIGSFVSEARDACMLPFLNGAALVCYGIPTVLCQSLEK